MATLFSESQLKAIAQSLGATDSGLTNSEIDDLFHVCRVKDTFTGYTKWKRIYFGLWNQQRHDRNRAVALAFIRKSMKPERYLKNSARFEALREGLNKALLFSGITVGIDGRLSQAVRATTIPEAEQRANDLRTTLELRDVHPDVLTFCKAELLQENYFHSVLEATKSIFDKLRKRTELESDGSELVDVAFGGAAPLLKINSLRTDSEKSEQKGFCNLVKGVYGMFRNPTAHEARKNWNMKKQDAEDLLTMASLIHRRIDSLM
jgi:uncharacterized protein (TIGR02391 family)